MQLLSTVKNSLAALRGTFNRERKPAAVPVTETIERKDTPAPAEVPAVVSERGLNLPRLALAVITKRVNKRHASKLAKAYYGANGVRELADLIEDARKKWLPKPGQLIYCADGTAYEVLKDGSWRKRPDMIFMRPKAAKGGKA